MTAPTIRRTVVPPSEAAFGPDEFLEDPVLIALYQQLIGEFPDAHGHLETASVRILWKAKGGKSKGRLRFGATQKLGGLTKYWGDADFAIWLAADHVREAEYTPAKIRALLSHEMRHIAWDEGEDEVGTWSLIGHDLEVFVSEIADLGNWHEMMSEAAEAFEQAPLFGDG